MYLESVPQEGSQREIYMNWLQFLINNYGINKTISILEHYKSIGWINRETCLQSKQDALLCHLNRENIEGDIEHPKSGPLSNLSSSNYEKHAKSLNFLLQCGSGDLYR